jgi:dUTP pyrophosphatase
MAYLELQESDMQVKIKITDERAKRFIPQYATPGSACFDLHALVNMEEIVNPNGGREVFSTGLAFEVPKDHVMLIFSRSGMGKKHGVALPHSVGVVDSDYRDEVKVPLINHGFTPYHVSNGDRIAQAMIIPVEQVQFEVVEELSETERGLGGFGSTGA